MTKSQYLKVIESIVKSSRNDSQKITMLKYSFETYVEDSEEKIERVRNVIKEVDGVANGQEYGLSYSQAINYLEEISSIMN